MFFFHPWTALVIPVWRVNAKCWKSDELCICAEIAQICADRILLITWLTIIPVPNRTFDVYAPSFLEKLLESHAVMFQVRIIIINVTWVSSHGISNHQQLDCFFNSLFRQTKTKISQLCISGHLWGDSTLVGGFPSQRVINAESHVGVVGGGCQCYGGLGGNETRFSDDIHGKLMQYSSSWHVSMAYCKTAVSPEF